MHACEECPGVTSTKIARWHVVPADDRENARLIVSRIILDTFMSLKMHDAETAAKRQQQLLSIRERLVEEGQGDD